MTQTIGSLDSYMLWSIQMEKGMDDYKLSEVF